MHRPEYTEIKLVQELAREAGATISGMEAYPELLKILLRAHGGTPDPLDTQSTLWKKILIAKGGTSSPWDHEHDSIYKLAGVLGVTRDKMFTKAKLIQNIYDSGAMSTPPGGGGGTPPSGPSFDADAAAFFAEAEALDATIFDLTGDDPAYDTDTVKQIWSDFAAALKGGDGGVLGTNPFAGTDTWNSMAEIWPIAGMKFNATPPKLKYVTNPTLTLSGLTIADYATLGANAGFLGSTSSNKYINTNFNDSGLTALSHHIGCYFTRIPTGTVAAYLLGSQDVTNGSSINYSSNNGNIFIPRPGGTISFGPFALGSILASARTTAAKAWNNGSQYGTDAVISGIMANKNITMLIRNDLNAATRANARIQFGCAGGELTDAQADNWHWCVNAWAAAFGFNQVAVA